MKYARRVSDRVWKVQKEEKKIGRIISPFSDLRSCESVVLQFCKLPFLVVVTAAKDFPQGRRRQPGTRHTRGKRICRKVCSTERSSTEEKSATAERSATACAMILYRHSRSGSHRLHRRKERTPIFCLCARPAGAATRPYGSAPPRQQKKK